ncbi:MAG: PKD domain-containing protein, partial [Thermoplasmata archaeon]|nr:PKD domain-containing protein [Thermoplasmata archaeon]
TTPVEDAYVKVMLMMGDGIQVNYSFTDSLGYYNINLTGGYDYVVFVAHEDYYFAMSQTSVQSGETVERDFMLEAISPTETSVLIMGYVLDEADDPVTDGNIFAFASDPSGSDGMPYYGNLTTAEIDGYFEVHVIPSTTGGGVYLMDLEGSSVMIGNETSDPLEDGQSYWMNITVTAPVFDDDAHLYGYVTDSTTSSPISGVMISVDIYDDMADESYFNFTITDASGYFDINVSSGSMDIQFQKYGYASYMGWETLVESGDDLDMSVELTPTVATIRGNITDAITTDPLSYSSVILYDGANTVSSATSNGTGYYELRAFEGADLQLFTEVQGYSRGYEVIDVNSGDELWYDFELYPVDAWLTGNVTDMISGDPIADCYIYVRSDNYEDWSNTNSTGYYNMSLVSGTYYVQIGANDYMANESTVEVLSGVGTVHDVELLPWNIPSTVLLHGWVNDSVSNNGISNAEVVVYLPDSYYNSRAMTNNTGYYEMYTAPLEMSMYAHGIGHAPYFDTMDATGTLDLELNILLDADDYSPNGSSTQSPTENVTWFNPELLHYDIQDYNLKTMQLLLFMNYSMYDTGTNYTLLRMWGMSNDPLNTYSTLPYMVAGDQYTVDLSWNASVDGGWLSGAGNDDLYSACSPMNYYGDDYQSAYGFYSNSTVSMQSGYAMFDIVSGDYVMFVFGNWSSTEVGDVEGTFSPQTTILRMDWDMSSINVVSGPFVGEWSVDGLELRYDYLVPSTSYSMLFMANDWGERYWFDISTASVDNDPPVADSGGDITAVVDTIVSLNASGSSDNVGIVSYVWEFEDPVGSPQTLTGVSVDYEFDTIGDYTVTLTVTDGAGHEDVDTFVIAVTPDAIPVANAGVDFTVDEDEPATFNGTGSSDDVMIIENYTWTILSLDITMYGESPSYTFVDPGTYSVELSVTDSIGQASEPDTVVVTVEDVTLPVADAGSDETVSFGTEVTLDGSGSSDNSGTIESYVWTFIDDGSVELTGETVDYEFTEPGVYTVTLTVADAAGLEDIDTVVITVVDEAPPVANAGADLTGVEVGDTVMLNGSGSTDNVGIDEYVWTFVDGTAQELSGRTVNYTFDNVGVFTITLTVTDAAGFSDTDVVVVSVSLANDPPVADAGEDQNVKVDATVTLDASGSTDDNAIVTYTWTFDYDGEPVILTGVEQEFVFEIAGTYNVTLTVTDAQGLSDTDTVEIVVESSAMSFIADYWWAFAVIAAAVVIGVAAALMSRGKGGKGKASPPTENEIADEFDDDDLPPPDDEL